MFGTCSCWIRVRHALLPVWEATFEVDEKARRVVLACWERRHCWHIHGWRCEKARRVNEVVAVHGDRNGLIASCTGSFVFVEPAVVDSIEE